MISAITKSKNTFTLAIIIWFHRPVLSYNKRQSRTGQMCSPQALVSFKKYMPPPLPYFKVNIYPFTLPHFASIFFAYL